MMLLGSKRDMENQLKEEVEERPARKSMRQKMQQVQKMQKKKGRGSWER